MMQTDNTPENQSFFDKALGYVKGFGMRIVVHGAALLCAGVMASSLGGSFVFLGTYLGLICLVARETSMKTEWVLPTGFGLTQAVLGIVFGLPLHLCIFWGGAQAFMQRVFAKKFNMGFEWVVAILLLPVALDSLLSSSSTLSILGSFLGLGFAGGLFWRLYKPKPKLEASPKYPRQEAPKERVEAEKPKDTDPFEEYRKSIAKIRIKQILLPQKLQNSVRSLTMSAEAIIICMTEDGRDVDTGKRFLNRYLPAAHSVLDNYSKHAKDAANNPQIAKALCQSEDIIIRLEQAFAYEHNHLLRNNIDDFSAELNVLDTLLKMDGK